MQSANLKTYSAVLMMWLSPWGDGTRGNVVIQLASPQGFYSFSNVFRSYIAVLVDYRLRCILKIFLLEYFSQAGMAFRCLRPR